MNKKLIHTVFENAAARFPFHLAVKTEFGRITYQELNRQANQLAHLLRDLGIGRESIVGTMMSSSIPLVTSLLGILKSSGVYLPVDAAFARKRLSQVFAKSCPEVLITTEAQRSATLECLQDLAANVPLVVVLDETGPFALYHLARGKYAPIDLPSLSYSGDNPSVINDPDDGNYLFYTSGSTGEAKAFLGCHKSLSHFIHWEIKEFALDETCRVSQLAQITFDASLRDVFVPLCTGGTLCIPSADTKTNLPKLVEFISGARITLIHCVPSVFRLITKELATHQLEESFRNLGLILMAGEPLYSKDIQAWRQAAGAGTELVNLYGTSETTLAKTFYRIGEIPADPAQPIHAGKPIDNTAILILNDGIPCSVGETGEIYIRTPFRTKGYYRDEELNRERFVQNPLMQEPDILHKTGDLGRYGADWNLEVSGRLDEQVKVNGIRVELGEIRQAVLGMEGVQEAIALATENADRQVELIGYYTGTGVTADALRQFLAGELPAGIIPAYLIQLPVFPLTINGKIDKKALPKPEALLLDGTAYEAVRTDGERRLENIWKEVLGLTTIGRNAPFFKIGGTSLRAIQVISRVYKEFGVLLKMNEIFANPTIGQLAARLAGSTKTDYVGIQPVPAREYYELTHAQQRLWIIDQFEQERTAYNIPQTFLFAGNLNRPALEAAFAALVERHEILRTTFVTVEGQPRQRVHPTELWPFRVQFEDLCSQANSVQAAEERALAEIRTPFDFSKGPLLRVTLLRVAADEHVLLFNMHHIISDGWSFGVMVKELLALYEAFCAGKSNPLSPLRLQYKDYAAWLNRQLTGSTLAAHRQYWLGQFEDEPPVMTLPLDFPRPLNKTAEGAVVLFEMAQDLTQALRKASKAGGVSVFMTLLAAVKGLLHAWSGQYDLVVGSPVAGRNHPELESQIGLFVNMLALRTRLDGNECFRDLLQKVKTVTLDAYEHQVYPFDQLIKELNLEYDPSRAPLTDVWVQHSDNPWVTFGHQPGAIGSNAGLRVEPLPPGYIHSKVDLTVKFTENSDTILGIIEYNVRLFKRSTIERMQQDLVTLLQTVTDQPGITLRELKKHLQPVSDLEPTGHPASYVDSEIGEDF